MQKRRIFLAMLLCMLWLTGFAQNDVTGVVKDGTGEPLIGVSVMIKGSTTGTVTDLLISTSLSWRTIQPSRTW